MKLVGNILVLTQWSFKDALVQTYTLPYIDIIRNILPVENKIILVTSEQPHISINEKEKEDVNEKWNDRNMQMVSQSYKQFGLKKILSVTGQIFKLYRLIKDENIKVIHAFCTPAGGLAYILSRLTGAKLVIDSYEPHAESMVENGTWKKSGLANKILSVFEKMQSRHAFALIATTEGMKQYALNKYGVSVKNYFVKPACVDLNIFSPKEKDPYLLKELNLENKMVCIYAGKLGGIYYKQEIFEFIKSCYDFWENDFRFLLLTSVSKEEVNAEIEKAGIPLGIVNSMFVFHNDIPKYLSLGDFAINPVKPVPTKRLCTSIKDGEYWAMGLPVVISPGISDDSSIIQQNEIGVVINFQVKKDHEKAVKFINDLLKNNTRTELQEKIFAVAKKYRSYIIAKNVYRDIY